MANREKKEEKKRGKAYPTKRLSQDEWNDLINYYEDTTYDERLKENLAPELSKMEKRIKELKEEGERERQEQKKKEQEDNEENS